jgi:AsmA protein
MKILKYLLIAFGGLVVLLGGLAAYIAATFDPNSYKPQIIQLVKDKKQRTLKLDGDIKLKFWPSIGADLGKLALSEFKSDKEFAAMDSVRVSLKVMPLLSKQVVVDEVVLAGVRANVVRYKNGTTNIDDLLSKDEQKQEQVKFDIDHVQIENAALTYRDEAQGVQYALTKFNLKTGRIAPGIPGKIDLSATVQANKPQINLTINLKTKLTFDLDNQIYALQDLGFEAKGQAADISNLNLKASGGVTAKPKASEFSTDKLSLAMTGVSGKDNLDIKVDAPKLHFTADKVSGDKVTVAAKITNAQGATIANIVLPGVEGTAQAFKSSGMTLDLDMKQGDQSIKAKLSSPVSGSMQAQQISLPQLKVSITASGPNLPGKSISGELAGSASVNGSKQQAQTNLAGKVSDSNIKAQINIAGFTPPGITFDVDIDQLDLDRYSPQGGAQTGAAGGTEKPIDLSALRSLRANGKLRIGSLKASNIKATNVRLEVRANGGKVEVSPLSANLYDGAMNGSVSVNAAAAPPSFVVKQNLSGISVGPLLKDLANKDSLEGKGTVSVDITTQGATTGALKRALNGGAAMNLRDGAVKGIDIAGTIRNARATLGTLKGQQTKQSDKSQKTDFSELSGTFKIANGVARNNDLSLKSPLLRVGGEGEINIGGDTINYLVKATLVGTSQGQGGREAADLKGITVPVRVQGPLGAPSYSLDFNALATDAVKQKVEDAVKDRLFSTTPAKDAGKSGAPAKEAPKSGRDPIKGLFGR